ncbi:hypothetical protein ACFFX0_15960 [Citricoccus parietis]|uniref:Uncharacterized protein n=1 Tax=Citricoccus parietis TaxID=592307 RepID=A0ABV5G102_9MICC
MEHLANPRPAVGVHPQPLTASATVALSLDFAAPWQFPMLSALPSMMPRYRPPA